MHVMADSRDTPAPTRVLPIPSRRRDKPQLSCNPCRKRKLVLIHLIETGRESSYLVTRQKCDRGHPCGSCIYRGLTCTYVASNPSNQSTQAEARPTTAPNDLQDRIGQLERLVTSLINTNGTRPTSSEAEGSARIEQPTILDHQPDALQPQGSSQIPDQSGLISLSEAETTYVESSHWTAILDSVSIIFSILLYSSCLCGG
jgi:hypothetical protein